MYRLFDNVKKELKEKPGYIEALKRRALSREMGGDLMRALVDISAVCLLEDFQDDDSMLTADRISKTLGKMQAKEAMATRKISLPSNQFIETYIASFTRDPILSNLDNSAIDRDENLQGFAKAKKLFAERKLEEVIPACTEEIECNCDHKHEALLLRATLHFIMGDYKNTLEDCTALIDDENADKVLKIYALIKRAYSNLELQETEKSINDFKAALAIDPTNCDIYYHRGQYYLHVMNLKKAMEDYVKAVSLNSEFAFAYMQKCYTDYRYACLFQNEEKLQDVLRNFEEGLRKFTKCSEYYSLFAQIMCDRAAYEKAEAFFDKALKMEPYNATIYVHKGLLELEWKEDADQAVYFISKALNIDPNCEFAFESLGTIEVQRGDLKRAVEFFEKAISLAKCESDLEHLFALRNIALAQSRACEKMDLLAGSDVEN